MHKEAREFIEKYGSNEIGYALDLGGYDVNGHCRTSWPRMEWTVLDIRKIQATVNDAKFIQADAANWIPDMEYDLAICTEVFEHTFSWPSIVGTAYKALRPGGMFLVTCASTGRTPHSSIDGAQLRKGEYYQNILPHALGITIRSHGFKCLTYFNPESHDNYAFALKV